MPIKTSNPFWFLQLHLPITSPMMPSSTSLLMNTHILNPNNKKSALNNTTHYPSFNLSFSSSSCRKKRRRVPLLSRKPSPEFYFELLCIHLLVLIFYLGGRSLCNVHWFFMQVLVCNIEKKKKKLALILIQIRSSIKNCTVTLKAARKCNKKGEIIEIF